MTDPVTYTGDDGPPVPGDPELISAADQARAAMAGVLLSTLQDNGDGTGTRTHFAADGTVTSTEPVTGLPIPDARVADLEARLDAALALIAGE